MGSSRAPDHRPRVLVIEDDSTIAGSLLQYLTMRDYQADVAYDGPAAIAKVAAATWDVVILDIGIPLIDGFQVLHHMRECLLLAAPVLILTACGELDARLRAFSLGADDCLQRPYALAELEARIQALHRRASGSVVAQASEAGPLRLDRRTRIVSVNGKELRLMPRSLQILERLMRQPGEVVDRAELERLLWPERDYPPDALRGQVYLLRRALGEAGYDGLETVHGVGFRLQS